MISSYLIAIIAAWVVAQGTKYVVKAVKEKSFRHVRQLYLSGNMPSAHSASVMALLVTIGWIDGVDSAAFAVAALFASIVMYDAMMVRRSSGEQGAALKKLLKEQKSKVAVPRVSKGHTPLEVAVGALLGSIVGTVVALLGSAG